MFVRMIQASCQLVWTLSKHELFSYELPVLLELIQAHKCNFLLLDLMPCPAFGHTSRMVEEHSNLIERGNTSERRVAVPFGRFGESQNSETIKMNLLRVACG